MIPQSRRERTPALLGASGEPGFCTADRFSGGPQRKCYALKRPYFIPKNLADVPDAFDGMSIRDHDLNILRVKRHSTFLVKAVNTDQEARTKPERPPCRAFFSIDPVSLREPVPVLQAALKFKSPSRWPVVYVTTGLTRSGCDVAPIRSQRLNGSGEVSETLSWPGKAGTRTCTNCSGKNECSTRRR